MLSRVFTKNNNSVNRKKKIRATYLIRHSRDQVDDCELDELHICTPWSVNPIRLSNESASSLIFGNWGQRARYPSKVYIYCRECLQKTY